LTAGWFRPGQVRNAFTANGESRRAAVEIGMGISYQIADVDRAVIPEWAFRAGAVL
jgi:hypothetical protein